MVILKVAVESCFIPRQSVVDAFNSRVYFSFYSFHRSIIPLGLSLDKRSHFAHFAVQIVEFDEEIAEDRHDGQSNHTDENGAEILFHIAQNCLFG